MCRYFYLALFMCLVCVNAITAENADTPNEIMPNNRPAFLWVNPLSQDETDKVNLPSTLQHAIFTSPSMGIPVGYYIYFPPGYETATESYPVVYYLHGGRSGAENKDVLIANYVDAAIKKGTIKPTMYVFPNGGPMSWYDMPDMQHGMGETVFVKELIPHIDETYRTLNKREGRALEGYSNGGRGVTRIMFKYPELFLSAAPGGSGYETEKDIQEKKGQLTPQLFFSPIGYNTYDLAAAYAERGDRPPLNILLWDGTKCPNFEGNKKYSAYLQELNIKHEFLAIPDVPHTVIGSYEAKGDVIMQHHQKSFERYRSQ